MSVLKPISVTDWLGANSAHASEHGQRYVLLCNEAGGYLRRVYVDGSMPEYVSHAGSVFKRQGTTGRYWLVTDYPATGVAEAKNYA